MTDPILPILSLSTEEVLYGDRVTSYRWEILQNTNGNDVLVGVLDGVSSGSLSWVQNAAVKGSGRISVVDLDEASSGMLKISDLSLESVRIRPVCVIEGLPENPLGVFLISSATEEWEDTGRVWSISMLDKCTVPSQDVVEETYAVASGANVLQAVRDLLATTGESITVNLSNSPTTSRGMVWDPGTSKLTIINDLLSVAGYSSLWIDGIGNFKATPRVLPADRPINYEVLGFPRELLYGENSIYEPSWSLDRDSFKVPNKVIAIQSSTGSAAALTGTWTNTDASSPYSYAARGRWITHVVTDVDCPAGTSGEITAFLQSRARAVLVQMSSVQATVKVTHLPIPMVVGDVLRFSHEDAEVDSRYVVTNIELDASSTGMMRSTIQEVVSL